jgi:hypothetical protein
VLSQRLVLPRVEAEPAPRGRALASSGQQHAATRKPTSPRLTPGAPQAIVMTRAATGAQLAGCADLAAASAATPAMNISTPNL